MGRKKRLSDDYPDPEELMWLSIASESCGPTEAERAKWDASLAEGRAKDEAFMNRRGSVGTVGIEVFRDRLRLRMPRGLFPGKQKYVYTPFGDDANGWYEAYSKVRGIESDIAKGTFDFTLKRYQQPKKFQHLTTLAAQKQLGLLTLWEKYSEYKQKQVAPTTFKVSYQGRYPTLIRELPTQSLEDAVQIRDYLLRTKTASTAKQALVQFNACCSWAVKSGLIKVNPFAGMASDLRVPQSSKEIEPFSANEREAIIQAFAAHSKHQYYVPFIKFLFITGCRTSEGIGLQWQDISGDYTQITFCRALVGRVKKSTKTGRSRKFPVNSQLRALLQSIRPESINPSDLVFTDAVGEPIEHNVFSYLWGNIVNRLVEEGVVERYRSPYNTRSTFITTMLEAGVSPTQVARWVGNTTEVISKHYAGVIKQVAVPEF